MVKATTPSPEKKEEKVTPSEEKKAITLEKPKGASTPPSEEPKEVTELKGQVETLTTQLADAQKLQGQADTKRKGEERKRIELEKTLVKIRSGEINPSEINVPAEITPTEQAVLQKDIQIGVQDLILENPDFQELLNKDITLKEVLRKNPTALLGEYYDADDAVGQIKDKLEERVKQVKNQPKDKPKDKEEGEKVEFEPGPTQPKETPEVPKKEEPSGTDKVEESIKSKIKFTG